MTGPAFADVTFAAITRDELNHCLVEWSHKMGPVRRPSRGWSHGLRCGKDLVAVAATDTLIRPRVAGFGRREAVELSRICAARPDLSRVVLRLWRSFVFPALCHDRGCRWAVSYQDADAHTGDLYRFDGWVRLATSRSGTDPRTGRKGRRKVIWGWCDSDGERRRLRSVSSSAAPRAPLASRDAVPDSASFPASLYDVTTLAGLPL